MVRYSGVDFIHHYYYWVQASMPFQGATWATDIHYWYCWPAAAPNKFDSNYHQFGRGSNSTHAARILARLSDAPLTSPGIAAIQLFNGNLLAGSRSLDRKWFQLPVTRSSSSIIYHAASRPRRQVDSLHVVCWSTGQVNSRFVESCCCCWCRGRLFVLMLLLLPANL